MFSGTIFINQFLQYLRNLVGFCTVVLVLSENDYYLFRSSKTLCEFAEGLGRPRWVIIALA